MSNFLSAYYASKNTREALTSIREDERVSNYLDMVFEIIRHHSKLGKFGIEIKVAHTLVEHIPEEAILYLLFKELTDAGYKVKFAQHGRRRKTTTALVYWGVLEEADDGGMGRRT